jgi:signal transduction histidine kinase/AraC-like DNA-binding protein/ABC-type xylose transport system substrate-binding protein/ActR/RegA family two-component response regulator
MKSRFFLLLLTCFLIAASCGREGDETRYRVVFSYPDAPYYRESARTLEQETYAHREIDLILLPSNSFQSQLSDLQSLDAGTVDIVIVVPIQENNLAPAVERLYDQGVPVILYDHMIKSDKYTSFVAADNYLIGQQIGDYTKLLLNGRGNILLIRGFPFLDTDQERYNGFCASIKEGGPRQEYKVIAECQGNNSSGRSLGAVMDLLKDLPSSAKVDAVVAFSDEMALGARRAFDSVGFQKPLPFFIGVNALPGPNGGIEMVDRGILSASFIYPHGGQQLMELILKILHGDPFEKSVALNSTYVDVTNVKVVKYQIERIEQQCATVDNLNRILSESLIQYTGQRTLTMLIATVLVLIVIIATILMVLYRASIRSHRRLDKNNQDLLHLTRELEETNQAKLQFFTNISHEFKTPLSLILNPLETLLEKKDLPVEERDSLMMMQRNAGRLQALINEILDFRQYEGGKMTVNLSPMDLDAFLQEVNSLFSDIIRTKQVKFSYEATSDSYQMLLDKGKVEKIYFNLLSNAFKFVADAGEIRVRMRQSLRGGRRMVEVSVFNSDSYIPENELKDIFQRFYKIDSGDNPSGTGIGLALAAALTDVLEGEIKALSEEGIGTTFSFMLPFRGVESPSVESVTATASSYAKMKLCQISPDEVDYSMLDDMDDGLRPRILVIDDNSDMRRYLKSILKTDYFVYLAENGREGFQRATQILPQLIICDILMPEINGYAVCKTLKEDVRTHAIPVILLSACSMDEQIAQGFESGADAYIRKPFSAQVLKVRIRNLIEKADIIRKSIGNDWLVGNDRVVNSTQEVFLNKIKKYIEQHLMEEISIPDLIRETCVSKSKFYRDLSEITEYSPIDIINLIRIKRALTLIVSGSRNISEAALEAGFSSVAYFSRVFLKYYKETPGNWIKRKMHQ